MYYPQLSSAVGTVIALAIAIYRLYCFLHGFYNPDVKPIKFNDKFELGYIEDNNSQIPLDIIVTETSDKGQVATLEKQLQSMQSKLSKMEKKVAQKPKENQLFNDCVATLMTLGYKSKRVAKNDVTDFLENHDISSVDQFVTEFFKKARKV